MNELNCFVEGRTYERTYNKVEIPEYFIKKGYFKEISNSPDSSENKYVLKVCGIANLGQENYVFFPKGYRHEDFKECYNKNTARLLFQAFLKYISNSRFKEEELDWLGEENNEIRHLNTITWLINDYLANGFYKVSERIMEENGKGRIEWAKTIKSKVPYFIEKKFLYLDLLTSKNNVNLNHIISKIHEKVIIECIDEFGWLFKLKPSGKKINLDISKERQIIILEKRLREINVAHEIRLIQSLIAYLKETIDEDPDFIFVTPHFWSIWEDILQFIFEHDESINKLVPKPYWKFAHGKKHSTMIPDILVKHKDSLIILDAKYYSIETEDVNKFPGWESVVKQLYYSLALKNIFDDVNNDNIKNIFLLPQSLDKESKNKFKYVGHTGVEGKEKELGIVHAFSLDIRAVLNDYVLNKTNKAMFKKIINIVDDKNQDMLKVEFK